MTKDVVIFDFELLGRVDLMVSRLADAAKAFFPGLVISFEERKAKKQLKLVSEAMDQERQGEVMRLIRENPKLLTHFGILFPCGQSPLDLAVGTGKAAIALAILKEFPDSRCDGYFPSHFALKNEKEDLAWEMIQ